VIPATCRISDVDITGKTCTLIFGKRIVLLAGRRAEALYATLIWAGVPTSGAAGSIYESGKSLDCAIDPAEVRQESGGCAKCTFAVNQWELEGAAFRASGGRNPNLIFEPERRESANLSPPLAALAGLVSALSGPTPNAPSAPAPRRSPASPALAKSL
jgi:hypothetical protein